MDSTKAQKIIDHIVAWLTAYADKINCKGFVIGISGGIDSALTSTLCGLTGKQVIALSLPIRQYPNEYARAMEQIEFLKEKFPTQVSGSVCDLTDSFEKIEATLPKELQDDLTMANVRSRLRMTTLYAYGNHNLYLVAGTGNKIEDFGVGFFTKYGDGGVDISPIADLMKSEVFALAKHLGVPSSIQIAKPTDGLWADGRSDEDQIGATYDELEWAMKYVERKDTTALNDRQQVVMGIFLKRNAATQHKINPIPICTIPDELKNQ